MKTLVVYFSRSGHNRKIAEELTDLISADLEEIVDKDPKGFIISGWQAIRKKKTEINLLSKDPASYDFVILSTPMWVGGMPPAVRMFIDQYLKDIKTFGFLSVSGNGAKNEKYVDALEREYPFKIEPRLLISDPEFAKNLYQSSLRNFAKQVNERVK